MAILEVEHLKKTYTTRLGSNRVEALKDVNFTVERGEFVAIMGESGSGKTTLLNLLAALDKPTGGQVRLNGKNLGELKEKEIAGFRRENLGFVFQDFNLLDTFSLRDNIYLPLVLEGKKYEEMSLRAEPIAKKLGITQILNKYPYEVSGGQKQRIAIARVFLKNPPVLILDEATSALDPQTTSSILALLKDINQRFNITIVIITHQMSVVREICSHVAIVKGGEVAEQGTVEDIFTHPKTAVARELLKNDVGDDGEEKRGTAAGGKEIIKSGEKIRIVFSENSAFEPVIANLILNFNEPVNILKADTKNVGGVAKGEMVLEFAPDCTKNKEMKQYLLDRGLEIEEVSEHVD